MPIETNNVVERLRDYIYDCTKDEFGHGWTLSAEQTRHAIALASQSLSDRIDVQREALKPFARVADAFDYWCAEAMPSFSYPEQSCDLRFAREDCPNAVGELTERDFETARASLTQGGKNG